MEDKNGDEALFGLKQETLACGERALAAVEPLFRDLDRRKARWQRRVLKAFHSARVTESSYQMTAGYGYGDRAREQTEALFAHLFGGEAALVRIQISSGTQMLATMLRGLLCPGERLLVASGRPYDTMLPFLGLGGQTSRASLPAQGVAVDVVALDGEGGLDLEAISERLTARTRVLYLQKSRGYSERPTLSLETIEKLVRRVRAQGFDGVIAVDYCYAEFVEARSPLEVGADLIAGSLIKNPGGGIAPGGGYVVGRAPLIGDIAEAMTAPSVGGEIGPQLGFARAIQQGLYFAPLVVSEALKGALFAARLFQDAGFPVDPLPDATRGDIVQRIEFADEKKLQAFVRAIQEAAPVDHMYSPVAEAMPGYDCEVIMASGSFVSGSSIELSADAPLKPPYAAYLQGGLCFENVRLAALLALQAVREDGG